MRRVLTADELAALAPYERNMETAIQSDWTRGIGSRGIQTMKAIRDAVTGKKQFVNGGCPSCVLGLVREVGRWYFADKEALAKVQAAKAAKTAKTTKPRTRKPKAK